MATDRWKQFVKIYGTDPDNNIERPVSVFKENDTLSLNVKESQSNSDDISDKFERMISQLKVITFHLSLITGVTIDKDEIGV